MRTTFCFNPVFRIPTLDTYLYLHLVIGSIDLTHIRIPMDGSGMEHPPSNESAKLAKSFTQKLRSAVNKRQRALYLYYGTIDVIESANLIRNLISSL